MKQPWIKVVFTVAAEKFEYTEGIGEVVITPIDIAELVASVAKLVSTELRVERASEKRR